VTTTADTTLHSRYRNALIGLAAGDAWGYQVEFTTFDDMPAYPVAPPTAVWRVSDDTQMTLAVADALHDAAGALGDVQAVTEALTNRFIQWSRSPQNNRAPGTTCMTSIGRLAAGAQWWDEGGAVRSAGCGAVMRLVPAAFAPTRYWAGLTALQALITHNHPRAVVPALLLAQALRDAPSRHGRFLDSALAAAQYIRTGRGGLVDDPYLAAALAPAAPDGVAACLIAGLDDDTEMIMGQARLALDDIRQRPAEDIGDLCRGVGEGWESASAVALALLAADLATAPAGAEPFLTGQQMLAWAATTNGDSDSIAALAGAVIGAAHTDNDYWSHQGLTPTFEDQYIEQLHNRHPRRLLKWD